MKAAFRFDGIDLARGLAIVGMVFAHLGPTGFDGGVIADYTTTAFAGYPSALFAVLAGVSLGLFHERGADDPVRTRLATLVRGVILLVAGTLMSMVQSTIAIVLSTIAVIYLLLFWLPRCKTWVIAVIIAVLAAVSSVGFVLVDLVPFGFELFMPPYPVLAWLTYGAVGVLVHRFLVGNTKAQAIAVVPALLLAAVGFVIRVNNAAVVPDELLVDAAEPQFDSAPLVQLLLTQSFEPHTGMFGDLLASITCAIAVICLCCLLCQVRWANILAYPLRAVGAMALTTYVAHVFIAGFSCSVAFRWMLARLTLWVVLARPSIRGLSPLKVACMKVRNPKVQPKLTNLMNLPYLTRAFSATKKSFKKRIPGRNMTS